MEVTPLIRTYYLTDGSRIKAEMLTIDKHGTHHVVAHPGTPRQRLMPIEAHEIDRVSIPKERADGLVQG